MSIDFDHYTDLNVEAIADHILVTDIESEQEKVVNGIIHLSESGNSRGIRPRWAQIYQVGPKQTEFSAGQWVLIEHGRWTRGVKLDDGTIVRKVDAGALMMISDDKPEDA